MFKICSKDKPGEKGKMKHCKFKKKLHITLANHLENIFLHVKVIYDMLAPIIQKCQKQRQTPDEIKRRVFLACTDKVNNVKVLQNTRENKKKRYLYQLVYLST